MRFHVFLFAAAASAVVAPQPLESDATQNDVDIAQLKEVVQRIKDRAPQAAAGGGGIASTLSDVTTLLNGLSDTLTGVCNLKQDLSGLLGQLSSLGL